MKVVVLYFAQARDLAGCAREEIELAEGADLSALRQILRTRYPAMRDLLARSLFAVNDEFMSDDVSIVSGNEIALVPPVSGG